MNKFSKILNYIILGFLISLCFIGTFFKHISFGLGLGDMLGYAILYITTLIHLILILLFRKKGSILHFSLALIFLITTIITCLKATTWRGSNYPWNGQLFYIPCLKEVSIKNDKIDKTVSVTMCTGEFNSDFSGKWNGNYIELTKENILYPKELKKYITLPIKLTTIEIENEGIYGNPLSKDTLKINKEYHLRGKISRVINGIPTIKLE